MYDEFNSTACRDDCLCAGKGVFPSVKITRADGRSFHWASKRRLKIIDISFQCPSDNDYRKGGNKYEVSYGFNYKNLGEVKPLMVNNPTETILIADSGHKNYDDHPWQPNVRRKPAGFVITNKQQRPAPIGDGRHLGTANILWVDGHVTVLRDLITIHTNNDKWDIE